MLFEMGITSHELLWFIDLYEHFGKEELLSVYKEMESQKREMYEYSYKKFVEYIFNSWMYPFNNRIENNIKELASSFVYKQNDIAGSDIFPCIEYISAKFMKEHYCYKKGGQDNE